VFGPWDGLQRSHQASTQTYEYLIELGIARLVAKDSSETSLPLPFQVCHTIQLQLH